LKKYNVVGIIPARGGSKGLLRKNIADLAGKPIIQYTIDAAKNSQLIDRVIVSTDDEEIAEVAKKLGAEVPFIRPENLATDTAPSLGVLKHAVNWLKENENYNTDIIVCLFPTYPFRTAEDIDKTVSKLTESNAESACTVVEVHQHPYWMTQIKDGKANFFTKPETAITERQKLPKYYTFGGGVFVITRESLIKQTFHFTSRENNVAVIVDSTKDIDIHTPKDLALAEFLMKK
jgi:CMP-N-acetylneuraminic acid synthetase